MIVAEKNRYKNGDVYPTLRHKVVPNGKKPAEKSLTKVIFTSFSMQVSIDLHNFRFRLPALHIQNL